MGPDPGLEGTTFGDEDNGTPKDESLLGFYSPLSSYGRRALGLALEQGARLGAHSSGSRGRKRARPSQGARSEYRAQGEPRARLEVGSAQTGGRRLKLAKRAEAPDPASVYHDQVYYLDGRSSAAIVPKSLYATLQARNLSEGSSLDVRPLVFGRRHSIHFWMRHSPYVPLRRLPKNATAGSQQQQQQQQQQQKQDDLAELRRHAREHLLCASVDGQQLGKQILHHRHHLYALFVRDCKLVLQLRRPLNLSLTNDANTYLPAEWRWSLAANQACDNKWHQYTINVNYPNVELYVDGQQFEENYANLVIVDDLPMTYLKQQAGGQRAAREDERELVAGGRIALSVGACWDWRQQATSGHFRGYLSALVVLADEADDSQLAECLGRCSEALVVAAPSFGLPLHDQQEGASGRLEQPKGSTRGDKLDNSLVVYQESQAKILLNGHDLLNVADALAQVAYVNRRPLPSIGRREIRVETRLDCATSVAGQPAPLSQQQQQQQQQQHPQTDTGGHQKSASVPIETLRVELLVLPSKILPLISLTGPSSLMLDSGSFKAGVHPFGSIALQIKGLNLYQSALQLHLADKTGQSEQAGAQRNGSAEGENLDYIEDSVEAAEPSISQPDHPQQTGSSVRRVDLSSTRNRIEACRVRVEPPLNGRHESFQLPMEQIDQLQLYSRHSPEGFIIYGLDSAENYQLLLRSVVYRNSKPTLYLERKFTLTCSDFNGRLVGNEFTQTLIVIDEKSPIVNLVGAGEGRSEFQFGAQANNGQPSMLLSSELTHVKLNHEAQLTKLAGQSEPGAKHKRSMGMLSLEQSTKLDRIAMAFLVFVISLIVMMLAIALTNLKEPGIKRSALAANKQEGAAKAEGRVQALAYDLDSGRTSSLYADERLELEEEEEEEDCCEEETEDEEEFEQDGALACQLEARRTACCGRALNGSGAHPATQAGSTDLESLSWDDELSVESNSQTTIVMNPVLHGRPSGELARQSQRALVIEQRPNWRGSMTQRVRTLPGRRQSCGRELASDGGRMVAMDEQVSSSCSSSSSSSSSSDLSASDDEADLGAACSQLAGQSRREAEEVEASSPCSHHYEIRHNHDHDHDHEHHHHLCLKRNQQTMSERWEEDEASCETEPSCGQQSGRPIGAQGRRADT